MNVSTCLHGNKCPLNTQILPLQETIGIKRVEQLANIFSSALLMPEKKP